MDKLTIGERLRNLRISRSLTLSEVAKILNITPSALGNYENNNRQPNFDILQRIAKFYDVSLDYLIGYENEQTKEEQPILLHSYSGREFKPNDSVSEAFATILNSVPALKDNELETLRDYFSFLISQRKNTNTKDTP